MTYYLQKILTWFHNRIIGYNLNVQCSMVRKSGRFMLGNCIFSRSEKRNLLDRIQRVNLSKLFSEAKCRILDFCHYIFNEKSLFIHYDENKSSLTI